MRKTGKFTKRIAVIGTVSALAVGGGVAWAAWLASGSGTGSASASSATDLAVTDVAMVGTLYPGASSTLKIKVKNPNPYPVAVNSVTISAPTSSDPAACPSSNVTFTSPGAGTYGNVPENGGEIDITLPAGSVKMIANADNGCQGKTFTFPVSVAGESAAS